MKIIYYIRGPRYTLYMSDEVIPTKKCQKCGHMCILSAIKCNACECPF